MKLLRTRVPRQHMKLLYSRPTRGKRLDLTSIISLPFIEWNHFFPFHSNPCLNLNDEQKKNLPHFTEQMKNKNEMVANGKNSSLLMEPALYDDGIEVQPFGI